MARPIPTTVRALALVALAIAPARADGPHRETLTGKDALGDWTTDAPGVRRKITRRRPAAAVRHALGQEPAAGRQAARREPGRRPRRGSRSTEFATGLTDPGSIMTAPQRRHLRRREHGGPRPASSATPTATASPRSTRSSPAGSTSRSGSPSTRRGRTRSTSTSPTRLRRPLPLQERRHQGQRPRRDDRQGASRLRQLRGGGHWTRDVEFSLDGKRLFVSVGSRSNVEYRRRPREKRRADILVLRPRRQERDDLRLRASATPSAWRSIPGPARSGPRSTSATGWATTSCPTTSPTSRRAASTAGPGTTSAPTRTRGTRGSIPS